MLKKTGKVFYSMKSAMVILVMIVLACIAGSLIPQGLSFADYVQAYGDRWAEVITTFGFDHVFTCWWFVILTVLLTVNLLLCSVLRFSAILRKYRICYTAEYHKEKTEGDFEIRITEEKAAQILKKLRFSRTEKSRDGSVVYAVKNKAGLWGAWLCHVGMLVLIAGFAAGQLLSEEYVVYGVPGEILSIEGTPYELQINDFKVELRGDDSVEQYTADLTMRNTENTQEVSGRAQVNHPMNAFGMRLYQNSVGWAAQISVYKNDILQKSETVCTGETIAPADFPELVYVFSGFYPDYANDGGMPYTKTPHLNNPRAVFALYYKGELLAMNEVEMGAPVTVDEYRFVMEKPQQYTLIQIVRDPAMKLAGLGGLVMLAALLLSFYVRTEELWYIKAENGDGVLYGKCRKGAQIFETLVREAAGIQREEKEDE